MFFKLERKMTGLGSAEVVSEKSTINVASNLNTALRHQARSTWD